MKSLKSLKMIKLTKRVKKLKRQYRRKRIYRAITLCELAKHYEKLNALAKQARKDKNITPMQNLAMVFTQIIISKLIKCEGISPMANSILKELKENHQQNVKDEIELENLLELPNEPKTFDEAFSI